MTRDLISELLEGKKLLAGANAEGHPVKKVALLGSFTLDYLPPLLAKSFQSLGVHIQVYSANFNQWTQEILDEASGLYAFRPDIVLLVTDLEDLFPGLYRDGALGHAEQTGLVTGQLGKIRDLSGRLLDLLPGSSFYLMVPALNRVPDEMIAEAADPSRGQEALESFLSGLRSLSRDRRGVVCVDWDWHARRAGTERYRDDRLWYTARMRLNLEGFKDLADLVAYYYHVAHLPRCKVIAVDLDNTLWGGVVGEDGIPSLVLGHEKIGLAFRDFQQELLRLHHSGILLAICSKNDEKTAWEVFDKHPDMVLKREHFAASRINWADKAENIQSLAAELSLGLDSFVFFDDDPVQRASVKSRLPVIVPDLPEDPIDRPRFLRSLIPLHRLELTEEDKKRSQLYQERAGRESMKAQCASLEEFLLSLQQKASLSRLSPATLARAAQLCQKTNQFNLTTKRYTAPELEAMLKEDDVEAYTLSLRDNLGDNGIVGFALLRFGSQGCEIDTFLMSCRVLGRKVERSLLALLCERARNRGAKAFLGRYLPTEKNGQTKDFYPRCGFEATEDPSLFRLDLERQRIECPEEIRIILETHDAVEEKLNATAG